MTTKLAAIAHSKKRNAFGLVGIEIDVKLKKIYVKLAKQWDRDQIDQMPYEIAEMFKRFNWGDTYIDQQTGQGLITELKRDYRMILRVITTQKNVRNPDDIEKSMIMDKVEMTQFMVSLKLKHMVEFPPKPSPTMMDLEGQIALYTEHATESGSIDYFAPGEEKDNLTKALLIACFAARKHIDGTALKFFNLDDINDGRISVLNKERDLGKTGLSWNQI